MKTTRYPRVEGGVLRNALAITFNKIFSNHMKRLVFISSILGLIYRVKDPDLRMIHKLNKVFKLAEYPEALQLPFRVKSLIWQNRDLNVLGHDGKVIHIFDVPTTSLNKEDVEHLSSQVVSQAPWWLAYSSTENMCKDLQRLFSQIQQLPYKVA